MTRFTIKILTKHIYNVASWGEDDDTDGCRGRSRTAVVGDTVNNPTFEEGVST